MRWKRRLLLSRSLRPERVSPLRHCAATDWATAPHPPTCCVGWPESCGTRQGNFSGWLTNLKRRPKREGCVPKKPKCWRHTEGEKGVTVTVYERRPGGLLYARACDHARAGGRGGYVRRSLKHRDQDRAKTYALDQAAKLRQGHSELAEGKTTLARLFALYQAHRTPRKSPGDQGEDRRRAQMFARVLGAQKDRHLISLGEWEAFIEARRRGALAPHGPPVAAGKCKPVRARTVHADCKC